MSAPIAPSEESLSFFLNIVADQCFTSPNNTAADLAKSYQFTVLVFSEKIISRRKPFSWNWPRSFFRSIWFTPNVLNFPLISGSVKVHVYNFIDQSVEWTAFSRRWWKVLGFCSFTPWYYIWYCRPLYSAEMSWTVGCIYSLFVYGNLRTFYLLVIFLSPVRVCPVGYWKVLFLDPVAFPFICCPCSKIFVVMALVVIVMQMLHSYFSPVI